MGKRATFTQAEMTRAIRAAKAAGMNVTRCEIGSDGSIILSEITTPIAASASPLDQWKVKNAERA